MNWEKIKNDFTHDKPSSHYDITGNEYFGRWLVASKLGWITSDGITRLGYEVYLTVLTVMGKESIWGSPKRKQKLTTQIDMLLKREFIIFNKKTKEFEFGSGMGGYFTVLNAAMQGKPNPLPKV